MRFPLKTRRALERVFEAPVDTIIVIENSLHARAHLGMCATTRPNRILLAISGAEFAASAVRPILNRTRSVNAPPEPITHGG
jgi:hypothetical protein